MVGRKQLLWAALAAGGIQLIGFVSNYLVGLATGDKGSPTLLVVAGVVSVIGGTITLFLQQAMTPVSGTPAPAPAAAAAPVPPRRSGSSVTVVLGLILLIVLCGVGGTAFNTVLSNVLARPQNFPGNFPDPFPSSPAPPAFKNVLAKEVSVRSGDLTLKVTGAESNGQTIRLQITAVNTDDRSMDLPLFKNCTLSMAGKTLEADPGSSQWAIVVPGNGEISGTVVFAGALPAGTAKVKLSFATVFRLGGGSVSLDVPLNTNS
ncbi:hypothetical protein [Catelliglobosispora koreensis]|uniref:hypothetical protein n=1 Tax=Catelliglobosispora koreensis TaxID=129052 RepID=UPI00039CECD6|nr:hypothetical protein [Catelliglobosispora koreensis]